MPQDRTLKAIKSRSRSEQVSVVSNGTIENFVSRYCKDNPQGSYADGGLRMSDRGPRYGSCHQSTYCASFQKLSFFHGNTLSAWSKELEYRNNKYFLALFLKQAIFEANGGIATT